jgi:hypothetical protein
MYVGIQKMGKRAAVAKDQALNIKCKALFVNDRPLADVRKLPGMKPLVDIASDS